MLLLLWPFLDNKENKVLYSTLIICWISFTRSSAMYVLINYFVIILKLYFPIVISRPILFCLLSCKTLSFLHLQLLKIYNRFLSCWYKSSSHLNIPEYLHFASYSEYITHKSIFLTEKKNSIFEL